MGSVINSNVEDKDLEVQDVPVFVQKDSVEREVLLVNFFKSRFVKLFIIHIMYCRTDVRWLG